MSDARDLTWQEETAVGGRLVALATLAILAGAVGLVRLATPALALPPEEAGEGDWLPLEIGNRWTYRMRKERTSRLGGGDPVEHRLEGTSRVEIVRSRRDIAERETLEVRNILTQKTPGVDDERIFTVTAHVSGSDRGVEIHAQQMTGVPFVAEKLIRCDPPLLLLNLPPGKGQTWKVGSLTVGEMRIEEEALVVGRRDVRIGDRMFENCLEVLREARLSGKIDMGSGPVPIESGSRTTRDWYARGLGLVRQTSEQKLTVTFPGEVKLTTGETTTRELETGPGDRETR